MGGMASHLPEAAGVVFGPERPPSTRDLEIRNDANPHHDASQSYAGRGHERTNSTATRTQSSKSSSRVKIEELTAELETLYRRLHKAETDSAKLQTEKLQSIDRFQPEFDPNIVAKTKSVDQKMNTLVSFLVKCTGAAASPELESTLTKRIWYNRFYQEIVHIDLENKSLLRKALKSMMWRFLQDELFSVPFMCYGDEIGERLSGIFNTLFAEPRQTGDSSKWRCLTVKQLEESGICPSVDIICQQLEDKFQSRLQSFGYSLKTENLLPKLRPLSEAAVNLAKLFASQRAIFEFLEPEEPLWIKSIDDEHCTNIDARNDEAQIEMSGPIAFIVSPALLKWGSGMGENLNEVTLMTKSFVHLGRSISTEDGF